MKASLAYPPGAAKPTTSTNQRNGKGAETILTGDGPVRIEVPGDREGCFEPLPTSARPALTNRARWSR
jgi:transposase-like protein